MQLSKEISEKNPPASWEQFRKLPELPHGAFVEELTGQSTFQLGENMLGKLKLKNILSPNFISKLKKPNYNMK